MRFFLKFHQMYLMMFKILTHRFIHKNKGLQSFYNIYKYLELIKWGKLYYFFEKTVCLTSL